MFVVINAYPRSTVAAEEIRRSVLEIAAQADHVEALLTHSDRHSLLADPSDFYFGDVG